MTDQGKERLLQEIKDLSELVKAQDIDLKSNRAKLKALMSRAKDSDISSYAIAKEAGISQPRVMQIIKGSSRA